MRSVEEAIEKLREELHAVADPNKAPAMRAYMKDHFDYMGVQSVKRNEILKSWIPETRSLNFWELIFGLWEQNEREFQYVALELFKKRKAKDFEIEDIPFIRDLIVTKSWWDTVDMLAADALGKYLKKFPEATTQVISDFRNPGNLWLMRSTLIFQLKYRENTDFELMKELILEYHPINEFFIQKAIGWALRQYSKINPDAVRSFVQTIELKTVARREAYKYI